MHMPEKKYFTSKFTSVLNRKQSLREVYQDEMSKRASDLVASRNRNFDIMIKQYAPAVFEELRLMEDITTLELVYSLSPGHNAATLKSFMTGAGKSSSFFFFTEDLKFAIKTINYEEYTTLMTRLLPKYYEHVHDHPDSLLARVLGVFSVRASHMSKIYIVIMRNLLGADKPHVRRIFDLKGSTFKRSSLSRDTSLHELRHSNPPSPFHILKDLDLLKLEEWICLSAQTRSKLIKVATQDALMLSSCNLMDYSLLIMRF